MVKQFLAVLFVVGIFFGATQSFSSAYGASEEGAHAGAGTGGNKDGDNKPSQAEARVPNPVAHDPGLTIWTLVVFLVVLAILYKTAWGPITEGLDQREKGIANHISETQRHHEAAKQLLVDYEKKIAAAHDEVRQIIDEGRRNSERVGQEMIEKARKEAAAEAQRGKQEIEVATTAALNELARRSSELAVELAGKIVRQKLTASDHAQLVGDAVSKFSAQAQAHGSSGNTPV